MKHNRTPTVMFQGLAYAKAASIISEARKTNNVCNYQLVEPRLFDGWDVWMWTPHVMATEATLERLF